MRGERGFALIAALGLLVALAAVGLGMGFRLRLSRLGAANAIEHARAAAVAEAALAEFRGRLDATAGDADSWSSPETAWPDTVEFGGLRAVTTATDIGSRLNLNRASEEELRRLFIALRIDAGDADRIAQAIADWRDPDDLRRARGAEQAEYQRRGLWPMPANGEFERLSELSAVLGMNPGLYARMKDHLTVRGTGRVNLNATGRPVLLALPGMTEQAAGALSDRRATRRPVRSLSELQSLLPSGPREALLPHIPALESRVLFETRELEVICEGEVVGSPVRARVRAVVGRTLNQAVVTWRQSE